MSRRAAGRSQRKSMIVQTSPILPRCHSPSSLQSPLGAPLCTLYWPLYCSGQTRPRCPSRGSPSRRPSTGRPRTVGAGRWRAFRAAPATAPRPAPATSPAGAPARRGCTCWPARPTPAWWRTGPTCPATGTPQQSVHFTEVSVDRFDSNDSNPSLVDLEEGRRSPSFRPRSRYSALL